MCLLCAVSHMFAYWTFQVSVYLVFFIVECGIARFLCAMRTLCVYSTFGHRPHPLIHVVPNFVSLPTSVAELTHPAYLIPGNRSFRFGIDLTYN